MIITQAEAAGNAGDIEEAQVEREQEEKQEEKLGARSLAVTTCPVLLTLEFLSLSSSLVSCLPYPTKGILTVFSLSSPCPPPRVFSSSATPSRGRERS